MIAILPAFIIPQPFATVNHFLLSGKFYQAHCDKGAGSRRTACPATHQLLSTRPQLFSRKLQYKIRYCYILAQPHHHVAIQDSPQKNIIVYFPVVNWPVLCSSDSLSCTNWPVLHSLDSSTRRTQAGLFRCQSLWGQALRFLRLLIRTLRILAIFNSLQYVRDILWHNIGRNYVPSRIR